MNRSRGEKFEWSKGLRIEYRDNIYDPHEGKRLAFSIEDAHTMGGDFKFTKYTVDTRYYFRGGGELE